MMYYPCLIKSLYMSFYIYIPIFIATIVAFAAVNWVYFKILKIAFDKNLVDNPDARKLQKSPVPVMGGMAVYFGLLMGVLSGAVIHAIVMDPSTTHLLSVMCAMSVMLYVGAMDDILGLTPLSRLVIEVLTMLGLIYASGMCLDTFRGMWGIYEFSWWLAVPLTVFAGVGIINAVNMIDGVNGLSSGLCMTCCLFYGIAFIKVGDTPNAVLAFTTIGALAPFFIHNVFGSKSRMFIGDAGTMVMGVLLTWFTISLVGCESAELYFYRAHNINAIALAVAILSVPIFDTLRVMGMRIAHKKSPFHPDKTHLHHIFVNIGVSHFITAMSEILIGIVIVGIWAICVLCGVGLNWQLYIVVIASICFVWGTYAILRYHANNHTEFLHRLTVFSVRTHLGRKEWWKSISAWLDKPGDYVEDMPEVEDQKNTVHDRFSDFDPENLKEVDRKKIIDYMKGRAEVMVQDIIDNSGADKLRVYPLLFEEAQNGHVKVIKEGYWGNPEIVALGD